MAFSNYVIAGFGQYYIPAIGLKHTVGCHPLSVNLPGARLEGMMQTNPDQPFELCQLISQTNGGKPVRCISVNSVRFYFSMLVQSGEDVEVSNALMPSVCSTFHCLSMASSVCLHKTTCWLVLNFNILLVLEYMFSFQLLHQRFLSNF